MRIRKWVSALGMAGMFLTGCNQSGGSHASRELVTDKDKVSYAIGLDIGRSLQQQSIDTTAIDLTKLHFGIQDVLQGSKQLLTDSQLNEVMMGFQQKMMKQQDSLRTVKADSNKKAGEEFLAKNAKEEGVVTLPSGLQYKVITEGKGKKPDSSSTVTVHYTGTLLDGTEFDSSVKRGQPATFPVKGVIPGWTEALPLMAVGSKWKLFIPPSSAYGANGAGQQIGPNSTLIFEVELLSIADAASASDPHAGHGH